MAYNFYPQYFYPNSMQQPVNAPQQPTTAPGGASNGIIWVQGEAAAKAYPVALGQSVLLMDSESSTMYIKSTDQSGMPQPLRIFDYQERTTARSEAAVAKTPGAEYVTRQEFDEFREDVKRSIKGIRKPHAIEEEGEG